MMWHGIRWRTRWKWFVRGVSEHYPLCCVLRFTFQDYRDGGVRRAATRGNDYLNRCGAFVVCGIFHHNNPELTDFHITGHELLRQEIEERRKAMHTIYWLNSDNSSPIAIDKILTDIINRWEIDE